MGHYGPHEFGIVTDLEGTAVREPGDTASRALDVSKLHHGVQLDGELFAVGELVAIHHSWKCSLVVL